MSIVYFIFELIITHQIYEAFFKSTVKPV